MSDSPTKPKPNETVVLRTIPRGLLEGLPEEDQQAIHPAIGKPMLLLDHHDDGRADLEFTDSEGMMHSIFVKPELISKISD